MGRSMPAGDKLDFSRSYTLTGSKGAFSLKKGEVRTLQVTQTESEINVVRVVGGHQNINKFPSSYKGTMALDVDNGVIIA